MTRRRGGGRGGGASEAACGAARLSQQSISRVSSVEYQHDLSRVAARRPHNLAGADYTCGMAGIVEGGRAAAGAFMRQAAGEQARESRARCIGIATISAKKNL
jgi:hypothetical protein